LRVSGYWHINATPLLPQLSSIKLMTPGGAGKEKKNAKNPFGPAKNLFGAAV
jgi:hypothetical protein